MRPNRIQYLSAAVLVAIGLAGASGAASGVAGRGVELAAPGRAGGPGACRPRGAERDRFCLRPGEGTCRNGGHQPAERGSAFSDRKRDEDVHRDDRVAAR